MKKNLVIIIIVLAVLGGYTYFSKSKVIENIDLEERPRIGLSFDSLVVERWKRDLETFVSEANENGLDVIVQIANDDLDEQRKQIQYLIDENVEVLVILPNDYDALAEEIKLAKRKGIKVIAYDRMIANAGVDAFISFDNVGIGEIMTKKLLEVLPDDEDVKNVIVINGDPKDNNSYLFNEGFYNVINKMGPEKHINIIEEVWAYGWREIHAFNIVEKVLNEGIKIDGIIAANDVLATGAIQALSERQMAGEVFVVSQDAELSACQRIVEGTQISTVYKPINELAKTAVEYSIKLMNDESLKDEKLMSDGINDIPVVMIQCEIVDIDNIEEIIIATGFHSRENIYMNIRK